MGLDMYIQDEYGHEVAYWRKFNALHAYFVKYLQNGVDDCQRSRRIEKEDVEKLIFVLKAIDEFPLSADVYLPTSNGFFFGGVGYDEWYYKDVKEAIPKMEEILERIEYGDHLYYQSSW